MGTITESDLERMLLDETAEPKALPFDLLAKITNGFSDDLEIGRGGFAVVYKAMLKNGGVAVKRLLPNSYLYEKEFQREIKCLMKVKHAHIVRFLGYCADIQRRVGTYNGEFVMTDLEHRLLCFQYLPKGSLHAYIEDASGGLEWTHRYKIIKGICQGLCYLHENNILHLDLKPANILLDENMLPKITDFGLSRFLEKDQTRFDATKLGGTMGYLPPEYTSHVVTPKFDLYSLGVVIMEILTGKKGYQDIENVLEIWSNRLQISEGSPLWEQIKACTQIAKRCIKYNPAKRPSSMKDIIDRLVETEGDKAETEGDEAETEGGERKAEQVLFELNGRCIYLVGMIGSEKSTVGKILAELLGYSYFDSDRLVEQVVGIPSVAQIIKVHGEDFFRDRESSALGDLSSMQRLVVVTGDGAVIRPVNWGYMKKGMSIMLDVPLDALAKRIAQVGTASRPLIDQPSGDPYTTAFGQLSRLAEQRGHAYANADVWVSLKEIAAKQGHDDVFQLTPTHIAIEALQKIHDFITEHSVANVPFDELYIS